MLQIDQATLATFLQQQQLPDHFATTIKQWYLPLAQQLLARQRQSDSPLLVGINGAQGSGKSTMAQLLTLILRQQNLNVANLSIDDFYLSHANRAELGQKVHPLLANRGVPGTHDLDLLYASFARLTDPGARGDIQLPRFDKAQDDRVPRQDWGTLKLPVDLILLEGWFIGVEPQEDDELIEPVNVLESGEDSTGTWRRYVNQCLTHYQALFQQIDFLVMLRVPSFDSVYEWRALQERKLAASSENRQRRIMDEPTLRRFIQHFERLTRHGLNSLPSRADLVLDLNRDHQISNPSAQA